MSLAAFRVAIGHYLSGLHVNRCRSSSQTLTALNDCTYDTLVSKLKLEVMCCAGGGLIERSLHHVRFHHRPVRRIQS